MFVRNTLDGPRPGSGSRGAALRSNQEVAIVAETVLNRVVPAQVGPAELTVGHAYVHDIEVEGDEDLRMGMRVEVRDEAGRLFAATVTDRIGSRWQLTLQT